MRNAVNIAVVGLLMSAGMVMAQDIGIGAREYVNSCAQCHGPGGEGDGYLAGFLNTKASDLTVLQRENGGVFPVSAVYGIIEGSAGAGVHGGGDMPAWGDRYTHDAYDQLGMEFSRDDKEAFVRARILALVEYLSSFQVE